MTSVIVPTVNRLLSVSSARTNTTEEATTNLWNQAFNQLSPKDRKKLEIADSKPSDVSAILQIIEHKQKECQEKQWKAYTDKNGETIMVRDIFTKITRLVNKFKEIGDTVVQYDPVHAALPWAGVRLILQVAVSDCEIYGDILKSVEKVAIAIDLLTEYQVKIPDPTSVLEKRLSLDLVQLCTTILRFFARAHSYYSQNTFSRAMKTSFRTPPVLNIDQQLNDVEELWRDVMTKSSIKSHDLTHASLGRIEESTRQVLSGEQRSQLYSRITGGKYIDCESIYEFALRERTEETCEWVLQLDELQNWALPSAQAKLMWIRGPAGFGKTFMTAWIIQYLKRENRGPVSYFFCAADNDESLDPQSILRQ